MCVCLSITAVTKIMGINESNPFPPWQPAPPLNDRLATHWEAVSRYESITKGWRWAKFKRGTMAYYYCQICWKLLDQNCGYQRVLSTALPLSLHPGQMFFCVFIIRGSITWPPGGPHDSPLAPVGDFKLPMSMCGLYSLCSPCFSFKDQMNRLQPPIGSYDK